MYVCIYVSMYLCIYVCIYVCLVLDSIGLTLSGVEHTTGCRLGISKGIPTGRILGVKTVTLIDEHSLPACHLTALQK